MKNKKQKVVAAMLAGISLGMISAHLAHAADKANTDEKQYECHGANACKGKGDCGGKGASCAGSNSCKGKGFIYTKGKTDCDALLTKVKKNS